MKLSVQHPTGFEFRVSLLIDWWPTMARHTSLPCYLTHRKIYKQPPLREGSLIQPCKNVVSIFGADPKALNSPTVNAEVLSVVNINVTYERFSFVFLFVMSCDEFNSSPPRKVIGSYLSITLLGQPVQKNESDFET